MSLVKVHDSYRNIISIEGAILYAYQLTPINSLFAEPQQLKELLATMRATLRKVNMPGTIAILGEEQNPEKILQYYQENYDKYGFPVLKEWFDKVMYDTAIQLSKKINYNYSIYIIFEDGKIGMNQFKGRIMKTKKEPIHLTKGLRLALNKVEEDLYLKLRDTGNLDVTKIDTPEKIEYLLNRMAFPHTNAVAVDTWDCIPQESHLRYHYITKEGATGTTLSKNFLLEKNENVVVSDDYANTALNELQMQTTPTDVFVKFEMLHHTKLLKKMNARHEKIKRKNVTYEQVSGKRDKEFEVVNALIEVANDVDMNDNEFNFIYQMQFRIAVHEDNIEELNARYSYTKKILEKHKLKVNGYSGRQEKLVFHVFPQRQEVFDFVQYGDPVAFTNFNFLGGFYIGHEEQGIIVANEVHTQKPILYQTADVIAAKTKTYSPTIAIVGTTGSGKSQLQNHESFLVMIVLGMPVLAVDPKADRKPIVDKFGNEIAGYLEIGGEGSHKGMFDPYLIHGDDTDKGLQKAKQLILELERIVNPQANVDLFVIVEAHEHLLRKVETGLLTKMTFTALVNDLFVRNKEMFKNTKSMEYDPMARLFFGDENTDIKKVFKFDKPYNLVSFANTKTVLEKTEEDLETKLFGLLIKEVQNIVLQFQRRFEGKRKYLAIDELAIYNKFPGASSEVETVVRTVRHYLTDTRLLTQRASDIPESVLSQIEMGFIGGQRDQNDIDTVIKHYGLEGNDMVIPYFTDIVKLEGTQADKKFNFVCIDYNNRKCIAKVEFLDCFKEILDTRYKG